MRDSCNEVLKNKRNVMRSFFDWARKKPGEVEPTDVRAWCERMSDEARALLPSTPASPSSLISTGDSDRFLTDDRRLTL
jgi:hypothetical protein